MRPLFSLMDAMQPADFYSFPDSGNHFAYQMTECPRMLARDLSKED